MFVKSPAQSTNLSLNPLAKNHVDQLNTRTVTLKTDPARLQSSMVEPVLIQDYRVFGTGTSKNNFVPIWKQDRLKPWKSTKLNSHFGQDTWSTSMKDMKLLTKLVVNMVPFLLIFFGKAMRPDRRHWSSLEHAKQGHVVPFAHRNPLRGHPRSLRHQGKTLFHINRLLRNCRRRQNNAISWLEQKS